MLFRSSLDIDDSPVDILDAEIFLNSQDDDVACITDGVSRYGTLVSGIARFNDPGDPFEFVVRNGVLVSLGEPRGHLITDSSYGDYRLEVEYRFPRAPGNAGVLVHASTPRALYGMFPRSIEVQLEHGNAGDFWCILEDVRVPDMERRRGPPAEWGSTEGKARRIRNLTDDSERPLGEWNTMVIEAVGRAIRVWVNGDLVNDGREATADRGRIALQSEGAEIEFRKVSLTPIAGLTVPR